jgi:hypothetical protein
MLVSRVICQTNWNTRVYVVFQSIISHGWQATGSQSPLLILLQCRQGNMKLGGDIQYSGFSNGVRYMLGWCCVFVTMLPDTIDDSSTSTRGLYLRSSQLCLINRVRNFKEVSYLNLWHSYSSFF